MQSRLWVARNDCAMDPSLSHFLALEALREGYEVYLVVHAVGGTSPEAHRTALERITQADAKAIGWVQLICERQRDWQCKDTAQEFAHILFAVEAH